MKMSKIWNYKSKTDDKLAKQVCKNPDIVFTKPEMAIYLISISALQPNDLVMEPCKGKGAFYDNLPDWVNKTYCEINEDKDYLQSTEVVDITMSNPPFVPRKLFWQFHLKAMQTTRRKIYWLINMSSLNVFTPNRMTEMDERGWYITKMTIVQDSRWFGRYVWVEFSKENKGFIECGKKF